MGTRRRLTALLALSLMLGSHNGYISLFRGGSDAPVRVFPYRTAMLPQADQRALQAGISVSDESMLHRLLEDYLS